MLKNMKNVDQEMQQGVAQVEISRMSIEEIKHKILQGKISLYKMKSSDLKDFRARLFLERDPFYDQVKSILEEREGRQIERNHQILMQDNNKPTQSQKSKNWWSFIKTVLIWMGVLIYAVYSIAKIYLTPNQILRWILIAYVGIIIIILFFVMFKYVLPRRDINTFQSLFNQPSEEREQIPNRKYKKNE